MNRAYSLLTVKAVQDDQRRIEGVATTPAVDRMGDIVDPLGVKFTNPLPLLWQHEHDKPIGSVKFGKPTKDGIPFTAEIASIDEAGTLKDRLDEAWQSIKLGLVRAVSIGFRPIKYAFLEAGGIHFQEIEVFELSAVTIPANAEALITDVKDITPAQLAVIKKFDLGAPAASGRPTPPVTTTPAAAGKSSQSISLRPKEGTNMKTLAEQIADLEAKRAANVARMEAVMQKSIDEGRSTEPAEQEEFDNLEAEVAAIDDDLKRLKALQRTKAASAKPVDPAIIRTQDEGADARRPVITVKAAAPEPGIRFARYAKCLGLAFKTHQPIERVVETMYGERDPELVQAVKAAVPAMTTGNTDALIGNVGGWADFVDYLRPRTIVGRFGADGIPDFSRIPFRVPLLSELSESDAQWVGEGKAKPLTRVTYGRTTLDPLKVASIAVQTMELLRDSSPASDVLVRNSLTKSIAKRMDLTFLDPSNSGSAGVRPASILNGISAIPSSGGDADAIRADVKAVKAAFIAANNAVDSGVWLMSATTAMALSLIRNPLGVREFPEIDERGGRFEGYPVITSQHVGDIVALVNAEDIWFGDEGGVDVAMSTEASLEMASDPIQDSGADTPVAAELVSMFQTNSVAFRAERTVNWKRRRVSAAAWLSGVAWGDEGGAS